MLALATCYCNDLYREAERLGVPIGRSRLPRGLTFHRGDVYKQASPACDRPHVKRYEASGMFIFWRAVRDALAISVLAFSACSVMAASDGEKLTDKFRRQSTNGNPLLTEIKVLESKPLSSNNLSSNHVYVVHAIRPDHRFEGKFEDEQFGVFLVDANQNRIVKVLDMFNTPRWLDYELKIKRVSLSKVTVSGRGASYGDGPITKTYDIGRNQ
jgi:hypothetical protein